MTGRPADGVAHLPASLLYLFLVVIHPPLWRNPRGLRIASLRCSGADIGIYTIYTPYMLFATYVLQSSKFGARPLYPLCFVILDLSPPSEGCTCLLRFPCL